MSPLVMRGFFIQWNKELNEKKNSQTQNENNILS